VLHNHNAIGNVTKWAVELAEFELDFISRHAVKSQVLADFVTVCMPPPYHLGTPDDSEPGPIALVFTGPY
jgi:hypothetical protein